MCSALRESQSMRLCRAEGSAWCQAHASSTCFLQAPRGGWQAPEEPHQVMAAQYKLLQYFEEQQAVTRQAVQLALLVSRLHHKERET